MKIIYLLLFVSCMSFFSSAKLAREKCNEFSVCSKSEKSKSEKPASITGDYRFDFSSLGLFIF